MTDNRYLQASAGIHRAPVKIQGGRAVDRGMKTYRLALAVLLTSLGCSSAEFVSVPSPVQDTGPDEADADVGFGEADALIDSGSLDAPETIAADSIAVDSGIDSGPSVDSSPVVDTGSDAPTRKRIFTTSETYLPNLGGLAGADAKCQTLADAAKLGGTYRAWLSDSKTGAKTRLSHATVPYTLVDGSVVATDWADLTSGGLSHAINLTEKGSVPPDGASYSGLKLVWTATETSGAFHSLAFTGALDSTCLDWTLSASDADAGTFAAMSPGRWDSVGSMWTQYGAGSPCRAPTKLPLYCLEQ